MLAGCLNSNFTFYELNNLTGKYELWKNVSYHKESVLACTTLESGLGFFAGGKDFNIMLIDLEGRLVKELAGHTNSICSLHQSLETELLSGSYDGTARVWDIESGKVKFTLTGHTNAVTVLSLQNGIIITGSAREIRLWFRGKMEKLIAAHADTIKALCEIPN